MIDWLVVWGVAQAAGFVFKPILEDLVKESAKDYAKDFFKDCLKKVIHLPEKDVQKEAYGKALKEFLQFVQQELEDADYQDAQIKQYIQPLRKFIQQDAIAAALGRAFEENCKGLDIQLLAQTWQGLNLPNLPPEFNWERVSKRYLKRVKAIVHESDKLRPIFAAQAQTSVAEGVQELVGIAPEFDLGRYAEGLKEQYGNLKLESL
ncbi:MAG: NTPase, partial [Leptolyngbyaceae cyanobacterium CAN_BIN12]|nr:NTPase [Leptolyngbyaceae cyanobacterium CAN_BIN12]